MTKKKKTQFTKILILITMGCLMIALFLCIFFQTEVIGEAIAKTIGGEFLYYCCKSFFETKEEKASELKERELRLKEKEWEEEDYED